MKKVVLIACVFFFYFYTRSVTVIPPERHYHEVCYLTSHNSYAASQLGYAYAQQTLSLERQLAYGVRGFMLDIVLNKDNEILLCHKTETLTRLLCRGKAPKSFHSSLVILRKFLHEHPDEIVTIFLENYVKDNSITDAAFKKARLDKFILRPEDLDELPRWPTIGWMRRHNKRIIIFNSLGASTYMFNQWGHVIENQWGTLTMKKALQQRKESRAYTQSDRSLLAINYFPRLKFDFDNAYEKTNGVKLAHYIERLRSHGLDNGLYKDMIPNFICLDFIERGNGRLLVEHLNELHAKKRIEGQRLHEAAS